MTRRGKFEYVDDSFRFAIGLRTRYDYSHVLRVELEQDALDDPVTFVRKKKKRTDVYRL